MGRKLGALRAGGTQRQLNPLSQDTALIKREVGLRLADEVAVQHPNTSAMRCIAAVVVRGAGDRSGS